MNALGRYNTIGRSLAHIRNAANGIGTLGVGHAEERELVLRRSDSIGAAASEDESLVLVINRIGLRVVEGRPYGADAFVEVPIDLQSFFLTTKDAVEVLLYVALRKLDVEETHFINISGKCLGQL